jgi:Domain of unknown function (DUF4340)
VERGPLVRMLVVLAVALGLGGYLYFYESRQEIKPDKVKEKVFTFDKAKVKEVDLAALESAHVVKEGALWRLTAPQAAPADGAAVDGLLTGLSGLELEEVVGENVGDLAQYGLAKPRATVTAVVEGGTAPLALLLGDKTPDGANVYAKTGASARVFTVAGHATGAFEQKPFDLRDRDVLHVKRDLVQAIEVTGPEGAYALASDGAEWKIVRPVATRAGRWPVDGLLGALEGLRMESVAAEDAKDLKAYGLLPPARTVKLVLQDGSSRTLELGSAAPGEKRFHARDSATRQVVVIPGAVVEDLAKGLSELRAKRLFEVATYQVAAIETTAGGVKRVYQRSSQRAADGVDVYKWKRTVPDAKDLDTNAVQDTLFSVGAVEVQGFIDAPGPAAAYGLEPPALEVTLKYDDAQKAAAWLSLGQKDGAWYAKRVDDAAVLKLDPAKAAELVKAFSGL